MAAAEESFLVFVASRPPSANHAFDADCELVVWRPGIVNVRVPTLAWSTSILWWFAHYSRIFRNRDYLVLLLRANGSVVHRMCVLPACARWPFMAEQDLQISSVWTEPGWR